MKALQLARRGLVLTQDYPVPKLKDRQVRIAISLAGICGADLEMVAGYNSGNPIVLGHEFVGTVESCPEASHQLGRRVVGEINVGCGSCPDCLQRDFYHCLGRICLGIFNQDGAFAEFLALPLVNIHAVPDSLEDSEAVFVEPVAAAFRLQDQLVLSPETRIGVLGAGKQGILIALTLRQNGYRPISF